MFYSSLYGWYTVPDELYFLTNSTSEYYGEDIDASTITDLTLALLPFTDKYTIIREKVVYNYTEYLRAKYDLEYEERNILYYVVSDSTLYKNVSNQSEITSCDQYIVISREENGEYTTVSNFENVYLDDAYITSLMLNISALSPDEDIYIGIRAGYPYADQLYYTENMFQNYYRYTIPVLIAGILLMGIAVCMFLSITKQAGRISKEDKEVYLLFLDKIPVELMFLVGIAGLICMGYLALYIMDAMFQYSFWVGEIVTNIAVQLLCFYVVMTAYLSLLRRGKAKQMWSCSLVLLTRDMMHRSVRAMAAQKNLVARTVELFCLYWFAMLAGLGLLILGTWWDFALPFIIGAGLIVVANIFAFILFIRQAKGEQLIRAVTEKLAGGDLAVEIPESKVLTTERQILDNIGHLNKGLQKAVEQSVYDERMKVELITNVSHDIKTPLTSIINYVDLIKREHIENENISHYIEVLDQKSHRLKQLTEDLVEMSRITSGNIELQCMPIDFCELVRQSIGEFEDKFTEHELQIVESITSEALIIYADGRRTFRIMDNLMQNIYKYAMPKTRVYIDLVKREDQIVLSIKNISKAELNIDAKELMERFVRGDQSRSTEGSGLGLSIAGDLVRIQNGTFDIQLDGDLFKVIIVFPEYESPPDAEEECTIK
jgi:signal transduction histidine kinase